MDIGLSKEVRDQISQLLNKVLSDEYVLYTKTLNYHWNVRGDGFFAMHGFFREQYEELFNFVDDIAERVRSLDNFSYGTMREFLNNASLQENPSHYPDHLNMVSDLFKDHESIIRLIRLGIKECSTLGDEGSANFLTDLMEKHEKMAWMLRAYLS